MKHSHMDRQGLENFLCKSAYGTKSQLYACQTIAHILTLQCDAWRHTYFTICNFDRFGLVESLLVSKLLFFPHTITCSLSI